jgi:argininosuccinate lyase
MQEDKEAVFDTVETVRMSLKVTATVLRNLRLKEDVARTAASKGYMNATELADYLVRKGMPFREAHDAVGRIVLKAIESGRELDQLTLSEIKEFSSLVEEDVYESLSLEQTLASKGQKGGTSRGQVNEALKNARELLD